MSGGESIQFSGGGFSGAAGGISGREVGYVAVTSNFTNQTTVPGDTVSSALITNLQLSLVGSGRPFYVSAYLPTVRSHIANAFVAAYFVVNGAAAESQRAFIISPSTAVAQTVHFYYRQPTTAGTTYLVQVGLYAGQASTNFSGGSTVNPMTLSAIEA